MQTEQAIKQFILDELLMGQQPELDRDENLLMTGLVDSLGVMRLMIFMEESFAIQVEPSDVTIENFGTVATMTTYVDQQTERQRIPA